MLKEVLQLAVAFAPLIFAVAPPFTRVLRTGKLSRAFFTCWGLFIFWMTFFSLGIPLIGHVINPAYDKMIYDWVPEPTGIMGVIFFGWMPSLIIISLAWLARCGVRWLSTRKKTD
jgi:hypothetical protein